VNLDQQLLNLRNTIRLIEQATAGVDAAEPAITAAMRAIAAIVRDLPDGLLREQAWQRARPQAGDHGRHAGHRRDRA
jgi:hypothetical protein